MVKLKKNKKQKRNPFWDEFDTEGQIIGFARPRKGRSSKKDRCDNKSDREWNW